jgi:regulatory protein
MPPSAYVEGLKMLARRELSEAQLRQRLARRAYPADDIDAAVTRLKDERALDDERTAGAIARTQTALKRRGRARVVQQIVRAGIAPAVARRAADAVFGEIDPDQLMEAALTKRLGGRTAIADDRERARLYRYLVGQGFDAERVLHALAARRR